ncbi:kinesin-like protein KIF25 isoform X2 [Dysidea avara]|uniref:kinesin-like protein KIF25 isoform X2 n=1 Tax=Dysidea avara TaxID=196820 RepID=UPI003318970B
MEAVLERYKLQRDGRIMELETENAILHLKLAQDLKHQFSSVTQVLSSHQQQYDVLYSNALRQASSLANQLVMRSSMQQQDSFHNLQARFMSTQSQLSTIQLKYEREKTRRKTLHNNLVELRGNIRVHCRVRPILKFDLANIPENSKQPIVFADDEETVLLHHTRQSLTGLVTDERLFEFDRVYGEGEDTAAVFGEVKPLLTSLLDGYNVCIMAYGQTGSGKTHTMLGPEGGKTGRHHRNGVIPLAVGELFKLIEEREKETETTHMLTVTVAEVYNEQIRDLLVSPGQQDTTTHHNVYATDSGMEVASLVSQEVSTSHDLMDVIHLAMKRRAEGVTNVHSHSSRSHLVVAMTISSSMVSVNSTPMITPQGSPFKTTSNITVHSSPASSPGRYKSSTGPLRVSTSTSALLSTARHHSPSPSTCRTKLQLVDLAGSECVGMSGASGAVLREAQAINKSLSALSDVLSALAEHRSHVPYRNSTLTHLLQDSIGGDAKLLLMVCVSPTNKYVAETIKCLRFGSQARQITRGPAKSQKKQHQQGQIATKLQITSSKR